MRKQSAFLDDVTNAPPQRDRIPRRGAFSFDDYFAGSRHQQAVDELERRGFAAPRFTEQDECFAARDTEVEFGNYRRLCGWEREADVVKLNELNIGGSFVHQTGQEASNRLLLKRSCESSQVREEVKPVSLASFAIPAMSYL